MTPFKFRSYFNGATGVTPFKFRSYFNGATGVTPLKFCYSCLPFCCFSFNYLFHFVCLFKKPGLCSS